MGNVACLYLKLRISDSRTSSINRNLNSISSLSIQSVSVRGRDGGRGMYLTLSCVLVIVEQASINRNLNSISSVYCLSSLNSISSLSIQSVSVRGGERGMGVGECSMS